MDSLRVLFGFSSVKVGMQKFDDLTGFGTSLHDGDLQNPGLQDEVDDPDATVTNSPITIFGSGDV